MDPGTGRTAADLVASLGESDLADLLQRYGEERRARAIAREIVRARRAEPITSTGRLAEIVGKAVGARPWERIHPATRTFQALRIAVNDELGALEAFLGDAAGLLEPGARLCVISFHSLEDRIVKNRFREEARRGGVRLLTRRPVRPGPEEEGRNPRARSARLRAVERIAEET